jgi:hypothetical protein
MITTEWNGIQTEGTISRKPSSSPFILILLMTPCKMEGTMYSPLIARISVDTVTFRYMYAKFERFILEITIICRNFRPIYVVFMVEKVAAIQESSK